MTPEGNWSNWLILAGRGWGKTRTGAEDVGYYGLKNRSSRIAVVAPTFPDGRDTCIEGESGLLACIPGKYVRDWNRSIGELVLVNNTIYKLYTAEKPDRLRGPQHHRTWCDEIGCLVAGTMVETIYGPVPIEHVAIGDLVATRTGYQQVLHSWCTRKDAVVYQLTLSNGSSLRGTANHPVWVDGKGFTRIDQLCPNDKLLTLTHQPPSTGTVLNGTLPLKVTTKIVVGDSCIGQSTPKRTGQYRTNMKSTTKTAISSTTPQKIFSLLVPLITLVSTLVHFAGWLLRQLNKKLRGPGSSGNTDNSNFTRVTSVGTNSDPKAPAPNSAMSGVDKNGYENSHPNSRNPPASNVACYSSTTKVDTQDSVGHGVLTLIDRGCLQLVGNPLSYVGSVGPHSEQGGLSLNTVLPSVQLTTLVSVQKVPGLWPVYDIEVGNEHEFFANGSLVHNSWKYAQDTWDMLQFGLRLGKHPQNIITSTPKPIKIIRDLYKDEFSHVTTGSTYDNSDNLPEVFLRNILKKYENTRLGLQELYAKILDDIPGALWQRSHIEGKRYTGVTADEIAKQCRRIVVSVDPAVTSGADADETGIVVAGELDGGQGCILADESCRETPNTWGNIAVALYQRFRADCIVGETNNGGDMVEEVIRNINPGVNFKSVTASRGKYVRAEPISALYEQGRIHHVGMFELLEDQMCMFTPDNIAKNSPDRADALVWALTELYDGLMSFAVIDHLRELENEMIKAANGHLIKPDMAANAPKCPACDSHAIARICGEYRCSQCGTQFGGSEKTHNPMSRGDLAKYRR